MKEIKLKNGLVAQVDDDDFPNLVGDWGIDSEGYAIRRIKMEDGWQIERMHNVIMGELPNKIIDHIDRVRLNNMKSNLRFVTPSENAANRSPRKGCLSQFKGVTRDGDLFRVQISFEGKSISVGRFEYEEDAALAYNEAAYEYFNDHAYFNDVDMSHIPMTAWRRCRIERSGYLLHHEPKSAPGPIVWHTFCFYYNKADEKTA